MSWKQIAIARDSPSLIEASNPDPIAKPSGKLWIAKPMLTIIPVFNKLLFAALLPFLNLLSTNISQKIITIIPKIIPRITIGKLAISKASGINSKQIIAVISPDANDKIKLKNLFEVLFNFIPIIPPNVVPKVPKKRPIKVVFIIPSIYTTSCSYKFNNY